MSFLDDVIKQVAGSVSADTQKGGLEQGLTAMFLSDKTPPFASLVGQLFGKSDNTQRAGLMNQLLAAVGPQLLSQAAGGALGRLLPAGASQLTPEQAGQLSEQDAIAIAQEAHTAKPAVLEMVSRFYAQHPELVHTLGSAALAFAMSKLATSRAG
ncbi:hypothetical protein [Silvimonas iriomotensis]|uniref:DUF937 domain-containing protein n=1 Tax=Silvimonas iriomotensis TaxID=449662 RepID=A0ABQ2P8Y2_9NEIS|nr:hypothetical protein [Silvimonas iriomotensis]GGP20626.1 hypothetical protein GCM10010970_16150 [Silvimonas iriomotensis]